MKKSIFFTVFIIIAALISSCGDNSFVSGDYDRGNGEIENYTIETEKFSTIDVRCSGKVFIEKGDVQKVQVKIDRNLFANLNIYAKDDELIVDLNNATPTKFEVYITMPNVFKIQSYSSANIEVKGDFQNTNGFDIFMTGSGNVYLNQMKADSINVQIQGSGDLNLFGECTNAVLDMDGSGDCSFSGKAEGAEIKLMGSGNLDMSNTENNFAKAVMDGSGYMRIKTLKSIDLNIKGAGNAYLYCKPNIIKTNIEGSGKLIYVK